MIRVTDLSKRFLLYPRPIGRLLDWLRIPARKPRYDEIWALRDITFETREGECLGIIGANGAGKSTLLRILSGITVPSSGECRMDGRISSLLDLGVGFHPDLTGRENILLATRIQGMDSSDLDARIEQMIEFVELGPFIDRPIRTYSSGMFVRLGFAAAAAAEPDLLIIDEVLSVGDAYFQRKSLMRVEHFKALGRSIVLASHSMPIIQRFCDKALWLHKGKIQEFGETREVVRNYELFSRDQDALLLRPAKNAPADSQDESSPAGAIHRVGTGEISIDEVTMRDASGQCRWQYEPGEALSIHMECTIHCTVVNPIFAVVVHDIEGRMLFASANYNVDPADLGELYGRCRVRYDLAALNLNKGTYFLTVAAYLQPDHPFWNRPSDFHDQAYEFKVWSDKIEHGPVNLSGRWEAETAAFNVP